MIDSVDVDFDMNLGSATILKVSVENNCDSIFYGIDIILKDYVDQQSKLLEEKYTYKLQYEEE